MKRLRKSTEYKLYCSRGRLIEDAQSEQDSLLTHF